MNPADLAARRLLLVLAALVPACLPARVGAQPANEPLEKFVVTDGLVVTMAKSGNVLYFGGLFNVAGPRTGSGVPVSATTGQAESVFPSVNGDVFSVVGDGAGGWFAGGSFLVVGGFVRSNIVHIRSDRTVDPNFAPAMSGGTVYCLVRSGSTLYAGGTFTNANGQARNRLAAFDAGSGSLKNWDPNANGKVRCMAIYGTNIFAGGEFTMMGSQTRNRLASVDAATGVLTSWNPNSGDWVYAMTVSGGHLFVGGYFTGMSSQSRSYGASFDLSTGALDPWNPAANGDVLAMDSSSNSIFLGGLFTSAGGSNRVFTAALDSSTGLATAWDARIPYISGIVQFVTGVGVYSNTVYVGGAFTNIGGLPRESAAALDSATGNATAWDVKANLPAYAFSGAGSAVYVGGQFGAVGCAPRANLAAFDVVSNQLTSWNPGVGIRSGQPIYAMAIGANQVFVGGYFTNIGGLTRSNLASLDLTTGAVQSWTPDPPNATIYSLATSSDHLYVGGTFSTISSTVQSFFAEYDLATLSLTSWNPGINGFVQAMTVAGNTLYAGGNFTTVDGQSRRRIAAFDLSSDSLTAWNAFVTNASYVDAIAVSDSAVYAGGTFSVVNGFNRTNFVALDPATAQVLPLTCNLDSFVYGLAASSNQVFIGGNFGKAGTNSRSELVAVDLNSGTVTSWNPGANNYVRTMANFDGVLYVGGAFAHSGGETTASIAAFPLSLVGLPSIVSNSTQRLPNGNVQFRLNALGMPQATVQVSTNLAGWTPFQTVPLVAGNGVFTDTDATNQAKRFFRVSVP